jgi:hypothetical protein
MKKRNDARIVVYDTLKNLGIETHALTRETKIAHILHPAIRSDFVEKINSRIIGAINPTQLSINTVGQVVKFVASQLPGDDATPGRPPGRRITPISLPGDDFTEGRRRR